MGGGLICIDSILLVELATYVAKLSRVGQRPSNENGFRIYLTSYKRHYIPAKISTSQKKKFFSLSSLSF